LKISDKIYKLQENDVEIKMKYFIFVISSIIFLSNTFNTVFAQTAPNCKSYFPEFKTAEELTQSKGMITKEKFNQIMKMWDNPPKIPSKAEAQEGVEKFHREKIFENMKQLADKIKELQNTQTNAELVMANALNLTNLTGKEGDRVTLYCYGASKREDALYEITQLNYLIAVTLKSYETMLKYSK